MVSFGSNNYDPSQPSWEDIESRPISESEIGKLKNNDDWNNIETRPRSDALGSSVRIINIAKRMIDNLIKEFKEWRSRDDKNYQPVLRELKNAKIDVENAGKKIPFHAVKRKNEEEYISNQVLKIFTETSKNKNVRAITGQLISFKEGYLHKDFRDQIGK